MNDNRSRLETQLLEKDCRARARYHQREVRQGSVYGRKCALSEASGKAPLRSEVRAQASSL